MWFRNILRRGKSPAAARRADASAPPVDLRLPPKVWRQLDRLQLSASRFLPGQRAGLRPSIRRKPAVEFRDHRKYVPGDDVRFVDWRASARHEHIFLKQGEQPKETMVSVLLDCSASMAWGSPPRHAAALALAAAFGYLALAHGDRLRVVPFGGVRTLNPLSALGPLGGKGQLPTLLNYLRDLPFGGQADFTETLRAFSRRTSHGGLVLVISDLLDVGEIGPALGFLPAPAWDVRVFHLLHPEELAPTVRGGFEMVDAESGQAVNYDVDAKALAEYQARLQSWRDALEMACVERHALYTLIHSDWSLGGEVLPHLRRMGVVGER